MKPCRKRQGFFIMSQLILIAGVSRSGKSSLAKDLCSKLEDSVHLDQDEFVKPIEEIPIIQDRTDWETPESIDWKKWKSAIDRALQSYSYVIVEGIFSLGDLELIQKASITILLSLEKEEYLRRRQKETRWGDEPEWFLEHVWESHLKHHNPFKIEPDIEISTYTPANLQQVLFQLESN